MSTFSNVNSYRRLSYYDIQLHKGTSGTCGTHCCWILSQKCRCPTLESIIISNHPSSLLCCFESVDLAEVSTSQSQPSAEYMCLYTKTISKWSWTFYFKSGSKSESFWILVKLPSRHLGFTSWITNLSPVQYKSIAAPFGRFGPLYKHPTLFVVTIFTPPGTLMWKRSQAVVCAFEEHTGTVRAPSHGVDIGEKCIFIQSGYLEEMGKSLH